jgi:gluconolactonase
MGLREIPLSGAHKVGVGVRRPECVAVDRSGVVWLSDELSACARVMPDGSLTRVGMAGGTPNGIAMDLEGHIVIANFGGPQHGSGPLQRLDPATGNVQTLCSELDGRTLFGCNYAIVDTLGRIWCSHSTWGPVDKAFDGHQRDGLVFRVDPDGTVAIVAQNIAFANGMALDFDERHLLVCETSACDVIRYPILTDGSLGAPHRYGPVLGLSHLEVQHLRPLTADMRSKLGATDGCGFDQEGNLWVTLYMANKVVAITPAGDVVTMLSDPAGQLLRAPTNVTWGGADLRDLYIGSVNTDYVLHVRSPVPGMPLAHQR